MIYPDGDLQDEDEKYDDHDDGYDDNNDDDEGEKYNVKRSLNTMNWPLDTPAHHRQLDCEWLTLQFENDDDQCF